MSSHPQTYVGPYLLCKKGTDPWSLPDWSERLSSAPKIKEHGIFIPNVKTSIPFSETFSRDDDSTCREFNAIDVAASVETFKVAFKNEIEQLSTLSDCRVTFGVVHYWM